MKAVVYSLKRSARLFTAAGPSSLAGFGLVVILIGICAGGVSYLTRRTPDFWLVAHGLLGGLMGWRLARSRLRGRQAAGLLAALGIGTAGLTAGGLAGRTWALIRAVIDWGSVMVCEGAALAGPEAAQLRLLGQDLGRRGMELASGVAGWLPGAWRGRMEIDSAAAGLVWCLVLWAAGAWAAWWARREQNGLAAALPLTSLLALTLAFSRGKSGVLFPAFAAVLGLVAWTRYLSNERKWQVEGFDRAEDLPFDITVWALMICLGAAGMAAAAAGPSPQRAFALTRSFLQTRSPAMQRLGESLGLARGKGDSPAASGLPGVLPRAHLIQGALDLSRQPALIVRVIEANIDLSTATLPYLRGAAYDLYTGQGWATSPTQADGYPPGAELPASRTPGEAVEIAVQPAQEAQQQVYHPGELLQVNRAIRVERREAAEENVDIFRVDLEEIPYLESGYRAKAWVTQAAEAELRRVGEAYPAALARQYLQLPADLPQRVLNLADELAASASTPYDRALVMEAYLRTFPYSLDLPSPPSNQDLVDFYLFNLQRGYCDYAASAMVVLARAAGIPARLAVGYVWPPAPDGGEPSHGGALGTGGTRLVSEAEAHSWPELYFPGSGWVAFEPTGGRPPRPAAGAENAPDLPIHFPPRTPNVPDSAAVIYLALAAALLAGGSAWIGWERRRLRSPGGVALIFSRLRRQAGRLGVALYPGLTPLELPGLLSERLNSLPGAGRLRDALAPAVEEGLRIVDVYVRMQYGNRQIEVQELETARADWGRLWLRLRLARMYQYFVQNVMHVQK